ncbi:MAG: TCP-1/cpn60 chaperonin family protein [Promethearchaeota archaeon]
MRWKALEGDLGEAGPAAWKTLHPVARLFESSFGPNAMDKMIFDEEHNSLVVTRDGETLAQEIRDLTEHPVPRALLKLAKKHGRVHGDHAKYLVVVASAIVQRCGDLVEDLGVHPQRVLRGLEESRSSVLATLDSLQGWGQYAWKQWGPVPNRSTPPQTASGKVGSQRVDGGESRDLEGLYRTALKDAFGPLVTDHLVRLLAKAHGNLPGSGVDSGGGFDPGQFEFNDWFLSLKVPGGRILESSFLDGFAVSKETARPDMPAEVRPARICLTTDVLYVDKPDDDRNVVVAVSTPGELEEMRHYQLRHALRVREKLRERGVQVLISEKGLSRELEELLSRDGVLAVRRAEGREVYLLARGLGAEVNSNVLDLQPSEVVEVPRVYRERFGRDEVTVVEGPGDRPGGGTFLLRGGTYYVCEEVERHLVSTMRLVVRSLARVGGGLLPGGGATELRLAAALRRRASTAGGVSGLVLEAVAGAFERVFLLLVESAGLDPIDTLTQARSLLARDPGAVLGYDATTREVGPTPLGLVDFYLPKRRSIDAAYDFAIQLLRVDGVLRVRAKPRGG